MAEVWEGEDQVLSRPVAVKVLKSHLAADGVFLERFRREAVTAARLGHPGIVATFDTGFDEGTAYIVMELVRGRNLREWLDTYGRLQPWQAVGVARQVADALSYAHQAGLVHRDVKPANILLVDDDSGGLPAWRIKVTDFGIAKAGMEAGADLTRTGMVLGTPKYLSPEQIRGSDPDARADLYSLGVVLYEMLVGAPPYVGETDVATALAHLGDKVPKPSASVRGIPGGLDRIVVDLLAKSPERRIPSAVELRKRLDGLGSLAPGAPSRPDRPRRPAASAPAATPPPGPVPSRVIVPDDLTPEEATELHPVAPAAAGGSNAASVMGRAGSGFVASPPPPPAAPSATAAPAAGSVTKAMPHPRTVDATRPVGTLFAPEPGGRTDEFDGLTPPPARPRHRVERTVGWVVMAMVGVGAIISAALLLSAGKPHRAASGGSPTSVASGQPGSIAGVQVYLSVAGHQLDNPDQVTKTFDHDPSTFWSTDHYTSSTFGNMYPGIGLEVQLSGPGQLHRLAVTSATNGWAASVYVSSSPVATGQPLSAWGNPVASQSGITGDTTFDLGSRRGQYVLLWITNLGSSDAAQVAELSVS